MKQLKKFIYVFIILISILCFNNLEVNALNLDSYQFWAETKVVTTNGFHTFNGGTGNNFNFALLGTVSDYITDGGDGADIYVKASVCMDPVIASQYANESTSQYNISNFQMYQTKTKCNFTGSSYTGGRIVDTYFKIWVSDSTDSFSAYWVVYPIMNFSIELISVEVNTTGFKIDYSSDTIIEQNETLIIQGATSIEYQKDSYNQQVETNNKLDETNDNLDKIDGSVNDLNDSINNSDVDNPSSKIEEFENMLPENGVITQLITLPISLFQRVLTSVNGTCQEYSLGNLFGTELTLPCINISNYLGTTLWNVIDVLFSGLFVLVIGKKMIKVFNNFTSMEEGDVLD